jgi:hypothetical protein
MNKIKFKIKRYDEDSNSIIVAFCSDETATNNPEDYGEYAMQPSLQYPEITDLETIKKKIAEEGIYLAEMAKKDEDAKANTTAINNLKSIVGQTFEYNVADVQSISTEASVNYINEVTVPNIE